LSVAAVKSAIHVHGSKHCDGRDSIVVCEGGDDKDAFESEVEDILDITVEDCGV
jgi:hypothetical protein